MAATAAPISSRSFAYLVAIEEVALGALLVVDDKTDDDSGATRPLDTPWTASVPDEISRWTSRQHALLPLDCHPTILVE